MSVLLYGIVFTAPRDGSLPPMPASGVGNAQVRLIEANGLGAAVSTVDSPALTPTVERALAYARVIESLHVDRTVLPMRYGSVLGSESHVVELLRAHGETYAGMLQGLIGCVEMGVRILTCARPSTGSGRPELVERRGATSTNDGSLRCAECRADGWGPLAGMTYLTRRQAFYAEQDRCMHEAAATVQRLGAALAGLFLKCEAEPSPTVVARSISGGALVGVHFLVKRNMLASFRMAFRRMERAERARLLLSGPWPPYNFAMPDRRNEWPR